MTDDQEPNPLVIELTAYTRGRLDAQAAPTAPPRSRQAGVTPEEVARIQAGILRLADFEDGEPQP